jgi:two-component system sensor histidine kinase PilS (NtrC family)
MSPLLKSAFMAPTLRSAPPPATASAELPWRVLGLMNIFRLVAPMVLLLVFFFDAPTRSVGAHDPGLFIGICAAYFAFGLVSMQPIQRRWPSVEWLALFQVVVDTVAIILLIHASGGVSSGLGTLLIMPAGATATLVAPRLALLVTSLIALALLLQTTVAGLAGIGSGADFLVAGLTGASLFAITLVAMPLANRLRESEALVKQRDIDLANLNELNEFIVQHLRESILVVDTEDRIRLINGTAASLLKGGPVQAGELLGEVSPRLLYLLETWRRQESDRRDSIGEAVSADGGTVIRPHFVSLSETGPGPVLVFLEDTSVVAERVQQSKLASLGRLSASIAHEIRNPVGAMSHAGQLLRESPALGADDRHLTDIIEKNAVRVSQIIESVLQLSRRETTRQERIELNGWLANFVQEFVATVQVDPASFRLQPDAGDVQVQFDPTHLHQVVWNLCDNALKHAAAGDAGVVLLRTGRIASTGRPFLEIADRGVGIDPANAERIFEPFFTDKAGGTGLGLFISRELCQTNGALLAYEARAEGGSIFRIIFADPQRWE